MGIVKQGQVYIIEYIVYIIYCYYLTNGHKLVFIFPYYGQGCIQILHKRMKKYSSAITNVEITPRTTTKIDIKKVSSTPFSAVDRICTCSVYTSAKIIMENIWSRVCFHKSTVLLLFKWINLQQKVLAFSVPQSEQSRYYFWNKVLLHVFHC